MTREQKAVEINNLSKKFGDSKAFFLVDFKGLNVEEMTTLRKTLRPVEAEMKVVRNTLAIRALSDFPDIKDSMTEHFVGTNAVVFSYGEAPASAKALKDFAETAEELEIKTGVMDGKVLDKDQVVYLATLPSKDELRAKLLAVFAAPATKFVRTLNEVPTKFVRVLGAYKDTK